jgi:hypothetical protein
VSWVDIPPGATGDELIRMLNERGRRLSSQAGNGGGTTTISRNTTTVIGGGGSIDPWFAITFADPFTVDAANGDSQQITLTADAVLADPVGWANGEELTLRLIQDATGGRTVTRATPAKWELPAGYELYALANRIIVLTYKFDSTGKGLLKCLLET